MAWLPGLDCDGHTAESRAQWLVSNRGLDHEAATRRVVHEFPSLFANAEPATSMDNRCENRSNEPSNAVAWQPAAICDGHTATSRAQWLVTNKGLSLDAAQATVMSEFSALFATAPAAPAGTPAPIATSPEPRIATVEQRCHLRDAGYLVMHGCVGPGEVRAARQSAAVQALLARARPGAWLAGGGSDPALLALAAPVWPTVRALLGPATPLPSSAQVAIKAPGGDCVAAAAGEVPPDAHIDGLHAPSNGVPPGEVHNFSLLVGVALTDVPAPNMGNLGVFPCSHRAVARAVAAAGVEAAAATLSAPGVASPTARLNQLVPLEGLGPGQPVCGDAGAAVLVHYQTVHYVQPNSAGSEARIMVYFRVTSPARGGGGKTRLEALTPEGLFLEWPGVAALPP